MTEMKHLQKSEINQVRILVYDQDETLPIESIMIKYTNGNPLMGKHLILDQSVHCGD